MPTLPPVTRAIIYTGIGVLTLFALGFCEFGIAPTLEQPKPAVTVATKPSSHRSTPPRHREPTATDTTNVPATDTGGVPMDAEEEDVETEANIEAIRAAITKARTDEFDRLWRADEAWWSYRSDIRACHRASFITDASLSYEKARARCLANPYYQR